MGETTLVVHPTWMASGFGRVSDQVKPRLRTTRLHCLIMKPSLFTLLILSTVLLIQSASAGTDHKLNGADPNVDPVQSQAIVLAGISCAGLLCCYLCGGYYMTKDLIEDQA